MRNCTRIPDLTQRVGGANSHGGIAIVHPSQQEIKGSLPPITSKCPNRAPTNFNGLILQRSNKWLNDSTVVEMAKRCYRSCAHLRLCVGYGREQRLNGVRVAEQTEDIRRVRAHPVVRMMQCRGKRGNRRLADCLQSIEGSLRLEGLGAVGNQDLEQRPDGTRITLFTQRIGGVQT